MVRTTRSNPLALAVLVCLLERPMHPYEIAQTLRSRAKEESVRLNFGSLYGVVESLERRGMVRARETVREGRRPERTIYEITDTGTREATDWLGELVSVPVKEYPQFMAALSFIPALHPDEALSALRQRAMALELRMFRQRGLAEGGRAEGLPRLFELESEYELRLLEAELTFVRELVKDIESGALDGLRLWHGFYADDETRAALIASLTEREGGTQLHFLASLGEATPSRIAARRAETVALSEGGASGEHGTSGTSADTPRSAAHVRRRRRDD